MPKEISKGFPVEIRFINSPVSAVGTVAHVEGSVFVVSLAPENERLAVSTASTDGRDVRVMVAADDALYHFTAKLVRSSGRFLCFSLPARFDRVQRRQHVRQPCLFEVEFSTPADRRAGRPKKATAVNISCGGLRAVYEGRVDVGDHVEVSLQFPQDDPPLQLSGTVLRKEEFWRVGRFLARVAVQFDGVAKMDERRLAECVTRLQVRSTRSTSRPK